MAGTVIIIGIFAWLQTRTRIGVACQATVTDPQMAESFGISLNKVRISIFYRFGISRLCRKSNTMS